MPATVRRTESPPARAAASASSATLAAALACSATLRIDCAIAWSALEAASTRCDCVWLLSASDSVTSRTWKALVFTRAVVSCTAPMMVRSSPSM